MTIKKNPKGQGKKIWWCLIEKREEVMVAPFNSRREAYEYRKKYPEYSECVVRKHE